MGLDDQGGVPLREPLGAQESAAASRRWWDADAENYHAEHGGFLADALVWGPEGLTEEFAGLLDGLGGLAGRHILELGCGGAQGARWLRSQGARVVGLDVSGGMLAAAARLDGSPGAPYVQASGDRIPLAAGCMDAVVSAHGALAFVSDLHAALREVARVLRPGGLVVFSVTHPVRWAFIDDPGPDGLTAVLSYFDRTPYVERDADGTAVYVEHHRTLGDQVAALVGAGLVIDRLVEPEWPEWNDRTWGPWSPLRGEKLPGTAIWVCHKG